MEQTGEEIDRKVLSPSGVGVSQLCSRYWETGKAAPEQSSALSGLFSAAQHLQLPCPKNRSTAIRVSFPISTSEIVRTVVPTKHRR